MTFKEQAKAKYLESQINRRRVDQQNAERMAQDEAEIIKTMLSKANLDAQSVSALLESDIATGISIQGERLRGAIVIGTGEDAVKLTVTGKEMREEALVVICPACNEKLLFPLSSFSMEQIGRVLLWEENDPPNPHPAACPALGKDTTGAAAATQGTPDEQLEEALLGFVKGFSYLLAMADDLEQKRKS